MPTLLLTRALPGSLAGEGLPNGGQPRTGFAYRGRPRIRPAYAKRLPLSHAWPHFSPRV